MLGYRTFFDVRGDRSQVIDRAFEQLHAWLRQKGYDADALEPNAVTPLAPAVEGVLLEREYQDGARTVRARVVEDSSSGRWTTQLTVHVPGHASRTPWVWLDVEPPEERWTATPRLAKYLLEVFDANDGWAELRCAPRHVDVDHAEQLLDVVCDPDRRGLVFLAGDELTPLPGWPDYVARMLADTVGLAGAYVLTGAATKRFTELIGKTHGLRPGTVRTYLPEADPADPLDARKHRILGTNRILRDNGANVRRLLGWKAREQAIDAPLRQAVTRVDRQFERAIDELLVARFTAPSSPVVVLPLPAAVAGPASVAIETEAPPEVVSVTLPISAHTLLIKLMRDITGTAELDVDTIVEFDRIARAGAHAKADRAALSARFRELQERNAALQDERAEYIKLLENEKLEHAETDASRVRAEETTRKLRKLLTAEGRADEAWSEEIVAFDDDRPESFDDLLERMRGLIHVEFTGDARRTRELDENDPLGTWAGKTWDALLALHDYAAMCASGVRVGGVDGYLRNLPDGCHAYPANRHARDESGAVRNNPTYANHRMLPVPPGVCREGVVFMGAHFKIALSGMISPRLHYYDDTGRSGKIYVGYIGRHLPTGRTN